MEHEFADLYLESLRGHSSNGESILPGCQRDSGHTCRFAPRQLEANTRLFRFEAFRGNENALRIRCGRERNESRNGERAACNHAVPEIIAEETTAADEVARPEEIESVIRQAAVLVKHSAEFSSFVFRSGFGTCEAEIAEWNPVLQRKIAWPQLLQSRSLKKDEEAYILRQASMNCSRTGSGVGSAAGSRKRSKVSRIIG